MATRSTAEERREDVLEAALIEFAAGGMDGTSTDAIARRAGISQPYLFRLYPTKKALFIAAVDRTFGRVIDAFGKATVGLSGMEAKEAMGEAYMVLLRDQTFLQLQLHSYAAACGDEEVRAATRRGFSRLWDEVLVLTGMGPEMSRDFMAFGMLLNVASAMGVDADSPDELCVRLLGSDPAAAFDSSAVYPA